MTDTPEPIPFWEAKSLDEMTRPEWESICDGCARCCLIKLEDEDDGEIYYTNIVCHLLDEGTCRCTDYANRSVRVPTCLTLTPETVRNTSWLPPTCGYRLLNEGHDLYWWHPLVSGDPKTVAEAGIAVTGKVVSEEGISEWDYEDHVVEWPVEEA